MQGRKGWAAGPHPLGAALPLSPVIGASSALITALLPPSSGRLVRRVRELLAAVDQPLEPADRDEALCALNALFSLSAAKVRRQGLCLGCVPVWGDVAWNRGLGWCAARRQASHGGRAACFAHREVSTELLCKYVTTSPHLRPPRWTKARCKWCSS